MSENRVIKSIVHLVVWTGLGYALLQLTTPDPEKIREKYNLQSPQGLPKSRDTFYGPDGKLKDGYVKIEK